MVTEKKQEIDYPEMLEYSWVKNFEEVKKKSKYTKINYSGEPVTADKLPKSPVNLVLSILKEAVTYPEIMEAYKSVSGDEDDYQRTQHLLLWFNEYLGHKYGNIPDPRKEVAEYLGYIVGGRYNDIDDPKLISDLLQDPFINPADMKNYDQL